VNLRVIPLSIAFALLTAVTVCSCNKRGSPAAQTLQTSFNTNLYEARIIESEAAFLENELTDLVHHFGYIINNCATNTSKGGAIGANVVSKHTMLMMDIKPVIDQFDLIASTIEGLHKSPTRTNVTLAAAVAIKFTSTISQVADQSIWKLHVPLDRTFRIMLTCDTVGNMANRMADPKNMKLPDQEMLHEWTKWSPEVADCLFHGSLSSYQGNHAEAVEYYTKAIRLNTNCSDAYMQRAGSYNLLNRYDLSISNYDDANRIDPSNPEILHMRGTQKAMYEKHQDAIVDFNEAIRISPKCINAYVGRGISEIKLNMLREAHQDLTHAVEMGSLAARIPLQLLMERMQAPPIPPGGWLQGLEHNFQ
jgi:tetratricopeptide (TPR) repeat protein